jgi:hypothetical protein
MTSDDAGGTIEQQLRRRWAEHLALPNDIRDAIDATRCLPVAETMRLLDTALAEDWFGQHRPPEGYCANGHELADNFYVSPGRPGQRQCRTCRALAMQRFKQRKHAA